MTTNSVIEINLTNGLIKLLTLQVIYEWYQPSKSGMKYLYNIIQKSWRKYKISNKAQKRVSDSW